MALHIFENLMRFAHQTTQALVLTLQLFRVGLPLCQAHRCSVGFWRRCPEICLAPVRICPEICLAPVRICGSGAWQRWQCWHRCGVGCRRRGPEICLAPVRVCSEICLTPVRISPEICLSPVRICSEICLSPARICTGGDRRCCRCGNRGGCCLARNSGSAQLREQIGDGWPRTLGNLSELIDWQRQRLAGLGRPEGTRQQPLQYADHALGRLAIGRQIFVQQELLPMLVRHALAEVDQLAYDWQNLGVGRYSPGRIRQSRRVVKIEYGDWPAQ
jgi:hypothetical protein